MVTTPYEAQDINQWYQTILGNPPSQSVADGLSQLLNSGQSTPAGVFQSLFERSQYQSQVLPIMNLYQAVLGRLPDPPGLNYWINQLASGSLTLAEIAKNFSSSPEIREMTGPLGGDGNAPVSQAFVVALYDRILQREPDLAGLQFWLNSGLTKADLFRFFSLSPEARDLYSQSNQLFLTYLAVSGEPPTAAQLERAIQSGGGFDAILDGWLNPAPSPNVVDFGDGGGAPSLSFTVTAFAGVALYGGDATGDITILANSAGDLSFTRQGVTAGTTLPLSAISSVVPMSADLVLLGANTSGLSSANAIALENLVGLDFNGMTYTIEDSADYANAVDFNSPTFTNLRGVTITGSPGDQVLVGSAYADSLAGGEDDDVISGGDGNDTLNGGEGNDLLIGGEDTNYIYPGSGTNQVESTSLSGDDTIVVDEVSTNLITVGRTTNGYWTYLEVSAGFDRATTVEGTNSSFMRVDARTSTISALFDHTMNTSPSHFAEIIGGSGNDVIFGGAGNDELDGGAGDDEIHGNLGGDWIKGGLGADTIYVGGGDDIVVLTTTVGGQSDSYFTNNDIVYEMDLNDSIMVRVNEVDNFIANRDLDMVGVFFRVDTGNNGFTGDPSDLVIFSYGWDALGFTTPDALLRTSFELFGTAGNDTLAAGPGDDWIAGAAGNDILNGSGGANLIEPGQGINTVVVNALDASDLIVVSHADSTNTIEIYRDSNQGGMLMYFTDLWVQAGATEGQTHAIGMTDGASMFVRATASQVGVEMSHTVNTDPSKYAWFIGGSGNDTLTGGNGNDSLQGNAGADVQTGGAGADRFVFNAVYGTPSDSNLNGGLDRITDLVAEDRIVANLSNVSTFDASSDDFVVTNLWLVENLLVLDATGTGTEAGAAVGSLAIKIGTYNPVTAASQVEYNISGTDAANAITGGDGNDTLSGGGGNDTITGGAGGDSIIGGTGINTLIYQNASDSQINNTALPAFGYDTVGLTSGDVFDYSANVEAVRAGEYHVGQTPQALGNALLTQLNAAYQAAGPQAGIDAIYINLGNNTNGRFLIVDANSDNLVTADDLIIGVEGITAGKQIALTLVGNNIVMTEVDPI